MNLLSSLFSWFGRPRGAAPPRRPAPELRPVADVLRGLPPALPEMISRHAAYRRFPGHLRAGRYRACYFRS